MGVDWSKQCLAASSRPLPEKRDATNSSYYSLVGAYALVAAVSFYMLVRHLRLRIERWANYAKFLGLSCAGSLLGDLPCAHRSSRVFCETRHDVAGLTAWAANARGVNSFFDSDSEPYKNTTDASLLAQQQRLIMQYDAMAAVYQFTQVPHASVSQSTAAVIAAFCH